MYHLCSQTRAHSTPPHTGVVCGENQASYVHPMAATLRQSCIQCPVTVAGTLSTEGEESKAGTFFLPRLFAWIPSLFGIDDLNRKCIIQAK